MVSVRGVPCQIENHSELRLSCHRCVGDIFHPSHLLAVSSGNSKICRLPVTRNSSFNSALSANNYWCRWRICGIKRAGLPIHSKTTRWTGATNLTLCNNTHVSAHIPGCPLGSVIWDTWRHNPNLIYRGFKSWQLFPCATCSRLVFTLVTRPVTEPENEAFHLRRA